MPTVDIPRLGKIEYEQVPMPEYIKGKTITGKPEAPILITTEKLPQDKLEHVVAHEVGHRNTLNIFKNAVKEDPEIVNAPGVHSALVRFLEDKGVNLKDLRIRSQPVRDKLDKAERNGYLHDEVLAGEILAEAYALSMTGEQKLPEPVERVFQESVKHNSNSGTDWTPVIVGGGILLGLIILGSKK